MTDLVLEIVEGPGAGRQVPLSAALEVGRDPGSSLVVDDDLASRRHARIAPEAEGAVVEDLGSRNGTFVNGNEVHGPVRIRVGDEIVVGATTFELRTEEATRQRTSVRPVPPPLAIPERAPTYIPPAFARPPSGEDSELAALLDVNTKARARTAALGIFVLVVLAVILFLATR